MGAQPLLGLRVIFFGMGGVFSRAPLEALLRAGVDLRAVVEPAPEEPTTASGDAPFTRLEPSRWAAGAAGRRGLPMAGGAGGVGGGATRTIRELAASVGAPTYSVRRLRDARFLAEMAEYQPDAICVACFTKKLPPALLALPRLGALNAHPSLLPKGRGPDPLFWVFHSGAHYVGLTVHLMDNFLDAGPILLQQTLLLNEKIRGEGRVMVTESQLESRLGSQAGYMLVAALAGLAAGTLKPEPQDDMAATYEDWPQTKDYEIDPTWTIGRAEAFLGGISERGQTIIVTTQDGARFRLFSSDSSWGLASDFISPGPPWRLDGEWLRVELADGVFTCLAERLPDA
jgi:methionyl-tRNA formyltransferase